MKIKNKGYVLPIAIAVLVIASLGLLFYSWWGGSNTVVAPVTNTEQSTSSVSSTASQAQLATDDTTLDNDSATIDAQLKALDGSNADVNTSLNDKSSI